MEAEQPTMLDSLPASIPSAESIQCTAEQSATDIEKMSEILNEVRKMYSTSKVA